MRVANNHLLRQNDLLRSLPGPDRERIRRVVVDVRLSVNSDIFRPGDRISHVYFPTGSVVSLMAGTPEGDEIAVALVGREGLIGLPIFLGAEVAPVHCQVQVQVPGSALRVRAEAFREILADSAALQDCLGHYSLALGQQIAQISACGRIHPPRVRLARWLLMMQDRVATDQFPMTHERLAQILGIRRATVTEAALGLRSDGLIDYQSGRVRVTDRAGLEEDSCSCYGVIAQGYERVLGSSGQLSD